MIGSTVFLKRHPELLLRQFENIPFDRIYQVNKSGIGTVTKATNRIVATKGMKQVGKLASCQRGRNITIICAMKVQENFIPLFFLFPRKRMILALMYGVPLRSNRHHFFIWMNRWKIFQAWLQHI